MIRRLAALAVASAVAVLIIASLPRPSASADSSELQASSFIAFGSEVSYLAVKAPPAARQLGALAAAAADGIPLPAVRGALPVEVSATWLRDGLGEAAERGKMPLAAKFRSGPCKCATQIGNDAIERVAALYVEQTFELEKDRVVELLELRARYRDAIVIAINGREVIRRNLAGDATAMDTAARPRGPETESFFIPVTPGLLREGQNTLRIEVRPSGNRASPRLDFELLARNGPRVVRGPIVTRNDAGVVVTFVTDLPVRGAIEWGESASLGKTRPTAGSGLAVRHSARLSIAAAKALHYRVVVGGEASAIHRVAPRPKRGDVVRFAVYGDTRGGHAVHASIVDALEKEAPDLVIVTGDLVLRGSDGGDWQRFFSVTNSLLASTPYFPAAGNHDMGRSGEERRLMVELFPLPPAPNGRPHWASWYSFDVADVHFVMLDSNAYRHDEQLEWLKKDLVQARSRGTRAIFAAAHDGPYSRGIHRGNRYAAKYYAPLLAEHNVAMLFTGHDHLYQRGEVRGLRYIVSGGGGAPLYPIRCGVRGKRRCAVDDGMKKAVSAYHYLVVSVFADHARVCPKRPNRQALEPCVKIRL